MPTLRCIAATIAAFLINAAAPAQPTDPAIDNLSHPAGTETCEPGTLGAVVEKGTGDIPLLLIPGAGFGAGEWAGFMERNADRYRMTAITPAGYAGTAPPPFSGDPALADMAWTNGLMRALYELADSMDERPIVVGHHMLGDYYALKLALDHPDVVRAVVVVDGKITQPFPSISRLPGEPLRYATPEERADFVEQRAFPFYRHVTPETWREGSFPASQLSVDPEHGRELFETQVANPIPNQLGYFLEYQRTDLTPRLELLEVPLLVIEGRHDVTSVGELVDRNLAMYEAFYGSRDAAIEATTTQLERLWGSVPNALAWAVNKSGQWERAKALVPDMRLEYVDNTGVFIMDDRPERFDELILEFARALATGDPEPANDPDR